MNNGESGMEIKRLDIKFSVCKVVDFSQVNWEDIFLFIGKTDMENSLVCSAEFVPSNYIEREDDWKGFRIQGVLDFALVGILSKISTLLAENGIPIYAISTYNTDYVLVKEDVYENALYILKTNDYNVII